MFSHAYLLFFFRTGKRRAFICIQNFHVGVSSLPLLHSRLCIRKYLQAASILSSNEVIFFFFSNIVCRSFLLYLFRSLFISINKFHGIFNILFHESYSILFQDFENLLEFVMRLFCYRDLKKSLMYHLPDNTPRLRLRHRRIVQITILSLPVIYIRLPRRIASLTRCRYATC